MMKVAMYSIAKTYGNVSVDLHKHEHSGLCV